MKYQQTIGIIGGMGSYATLDIFRRFLEAFPAEKEWDRPRILIDNRCTMPSRVRAILYQEERPALVSELAKAAQGLINCGADYLVFACNTSHVFLDEIFRLVPAARSKTIHLIHALAEKMAEDNIRGAYLLASEGTIESKIYQSLFPQYDIVLTVPDAACFKQIRMQIEIVKQNCLNADARACFHEFCESIPEKYIILGCTELPILAVGYDGKKILLDPIDAVIQKTRKMIR